MEQQYLSLCQRIINEGVWVENKRTGKKCLTVINADFEYDISDGKFPVLTTKKSYWKAAVAEMLGYLRGYNNASQFRELGTKTWDKNANVSPHWLSNPFRKGEGDLGRSYGVQGRGWMSPEGKPIDQLKMIVDDLSKGIDNRREILTFWNPGESDRMCLPACMHTHTFSLLGDQLYLTSYQRSIDVPLGLGFNMIQVSWLLAIMAQITGNKPAKAFHKLVNCHLYEDQVSLMRDVQLQRVPYEPPTFKINPDIKSLDDLETWVTLADFELVGYEHHPAIDYPFSE